MQPVLIISAIIVAFLFIRWLTRQPKRTIWLWMVGIIAVGLIILVATGRMHWMVAAGAGATALFAKLLALLRFAPLLARLFQIFRHTKRTTSDTGGYTRTGYNQNRSTRNMHNMTPTEAYKILGLRPGCSRDDIITAHRRLIQKNHPDQGGAPHIASLINQARDCLLDEQKPT